MGHIYWYEQTTYLVLLIGQLTELQDTLHENIVITVWLQSADRLSH